MQNLGNISSIGDSADSNAGVDVAAKPELQIQAKKGWILNPLLDYLFVSGGLMWLLYAVTFAGVSATGADPKSQFYGSILFWGALLITDAHGPATLVRVFGSKTTPGKVRFLVAAWAVVLLVVSYFSVSQEIVAQFFVKITLLWVVQHYIAQTFGVVLIYCFKRDYRLSKAERFVFQGLMRSLMYFVLVRMLTYPEYGRIDNFMGLQVPFWGPLPSLCVLFTGYIFFLFVLAFVGFAVRHYFVHKQSFPLPGLLAILTVAAVTLSPRNGFYLLGVTFYHASQYLAITFSYFLKENAINKNGSVPLSTVRQFFTRQALIYLVIITAIGYLTTNTIPVYLIKNGLSGALVLGTTYALLNCHHFLADALIWRIRDPEVRKLLV